MESVYESISYQLSQTNHQYGKRVHLLADPLAATLLARLCLAETRQPEINFLVTELYRILLNNVINEQLERKPAQYSTRMAQFHGDAARLSIEAIVATQKVVSVSLARAGTLPSHVCYEFLNHVLDSQFVRQDHIAIQRQTDHTQQVLGAHASGCKIGGSVDGAIVLFPDPMGATGSTINTVVNIYKNGHFGKVKKFIAMHLVITPEYIQNMQNMCPELEIYALRLDRGLSAQEILSTPLGTRIGSERGLNDRQYIVPGGGGLGELLNNAEF